MTREITTVAGLRYELSAPGYSRTARVCVYGPPVDGNRSVIASVPVALGKLRRSMEALTGTERLHAGVDIESNEEWRARLIEQPGAPRNMRIWIY